jgi:hypothetical protein
MKQIKQYLLRQPEGEHKNNNYSDFQRFTEDFRKILKKQNNSGYDYETFPEGVYFHDLQNTSNTLNISYIEGKYDRAFYYSLKRIDWHLFLSIQFRTPKYNGRSSSAQLKRRGFIKEFFEEIIVSQNLSQNDLQYFCFEERNSLIGSHLHLVVHCKHPELVSVDQTRLAMLQLLEDNEHIAIIPTGHTKHVQIVDYSDKVLKYCLKLRLDDTEKPYFHSNGFTRFYQRHLNWLAKQKSDSWTTLGSTTSSVCIPNAKISAFGTPDTQITQSKAKSSINDVSGDSGTSVTTHSHHLNCLLDGNRAYLPKNYCDEAEYRQDMIDQYESIKAEYSDGSADNW